VDQKPLPKEPESEEKKKNKKQSKGKPFTLADVGSLP